MRLGSFCLGSDEAMEALLARVGRGDPDAISWHRNMLVNHRKVQIKRIVCRDHLGVVPEPAPLGIFSLRVISLRKRISGSIAAV